MSVDEKRAGHGATDAAPRSSRDLTGPPADRWTGCLEAFERDRLGFLMNAHRHHGPLARFDDHATIVSDHLLANEVLQRHSDFAILTNFRSERLDPAAAARTEDIRRHLNPPLRATALEGLAELVDREVGREVDNVAGGGPFDPLPALERAFARAMATFYFEDMGIEVATSVHRLLDALSAIFGNPLALPARFPTPANVRARRRYGQVRRIVDECLAARLNDGTAHDDLASRVATAAVCAGHSQVRVADLLIGSLLAGIRVPAAGAAWSLLELARHPEQECALESDAGLLALVLESVRLHPPTWLIRRVTTRTTCLGGYEFPAGHSFLISPYVLHRDESLFAQAEEFRPDRWTGGSLTGLLSFGRGIHRCPGQDAGLTMITTAMRTLTRNRRIQVPPAVEVRADPRTTLVPSGLQIRLTSATRSAR